MSYQFSLLQKRMDALIPIVNWRHMFRSFNLPVESSGKSSDRYRVLQTAGILTNETAQELQKYLETSESKLSFIGHFIILEAVKKYNDIVLGRIPIELD